MADAHALAVLHTPRGSRRYGVVLILVLLSVVFQMASPDRAGFRLTGGMLQMATLLVAIYSSDVHRRDRPFMSVVVLLGLVALVVGLAHEGETGLGISLATVGVLTALSLVVIALGVIAGIREAGHVTVQAVVGVICVYLLIGLLFSYVYGTIAAFGEGDFFSQGTDGDHQDQLYFSFITQTTVGYGDFTPKAPLGRSLAAVEALIGQIYLVTVVALMVSNLRPRGGRGGSGEAEA
jgi:hypothetical protein